MKFTAAGRKFLVAMLCSFAIYLFPITILFLNGDGWNRPLALMLDGHSGIATVTKIEPSNHETCEYYYEFGLKKFWGSSQGCHAEIGDKVPITFLPANPNFQMIGSPLSEFLVQTIGLGLFSLFCG